MTKITTENQTVRAKERQKYLLVRTHKVIPPQGRAIQPMECDPPKIQLGIMDT